MDAAVQQAQKADPQSEEGTGMSIDLRSRQGWEALKALLDERMDEVLRICRLDTPRRKGWTLIDDPRGNGRDCFGLCVKGDGLSWKKFNGTEKGRSLELIAYCEGWYHLPNRGAEQAATLAIARLGLGSISAEQLQKDRAKAKERQAVAHAEDRSQAERRAAAAFAIFMNARPILDTPGEFYLREARGIDLRAAPFIGPRGGALAPGSLRFLPHHKYLIRDRKNVVTGEIFAPCIVACCTNANGDIRALHQTWLRPDGSDKADIPPAPDGTRQKPRRVLGEFRGLAIPLWRGEGHFTRKQAAAHGLLQTQGLSEGVEDGLSGVIAAPTHRWAAMISLSNLVNIPDWLPECVDSVIVHRQNEWDNPSAVAAFENGLRALRSTGRAVAEVAAIYGKDLNDTLRGAA
jgi:hypothetical protein